MLKKAYMDLIERNAIARVHTNLQIPTRRPNETYTWGTTDGGSSPGYLAIRMTSEIRYESEVAGVRRAEKYCVRKKLHDDLNQTRELAAKIGLKS